MLLTETEVSSTSMYSGTPPFHHTKKSSLQRETDFAGWSIFTDFKRSPSVQAAHHQDDSALLTSVSIIGHAEDQPQQTLRLLPLLQQNLCIARQPQEQAKGDERVRWDGRHGACHVTSSVRRCWSGRHRIYVGLPKYTTLLVPL